MSSTEYCTYILSFFTFFDEYQSYNSCPPRTLTSRDIHPPPSIQLNFDPPTCRAWVHWISSTEGGWGGEGLRNLWWGGGGGDKRLCNLKKPQTLSDGEREREWEREREPIGGDTVTQIVLLCYAVLSAVNIFNMFRRPGYNLSISLSGSSKKKFFKQMILGSSHICFLARVAHTDDFRYSWHRCFWVILTDEFWQFTYRRFKVVDTDVLM